MIPGKKPASDAPNRKRSTLNEVASQTKAIAPEHRPQVTITRAIQIRAPTLSRTMFEGTSNRKYPQKKMPAPKPNTAGEKPRSLFIVNEAKPDVSLDRYRR